MGLLIRQEGRTWVLEVKEAWYVNVPADVPKIIDFMVKNKILFSVGYSVNPIIFLNGVVWKTDVFSMLKSVLNNLLIYKGRYGHRSGENR